MKLERLVKIIAEENAAGARRLIDRAIAALEQRLPSLFADQYRGVYQRDLRYPRGALVTDHGALWLATADTGARPGSEDSGWKMVAKSGGKAGQTGELEARVRALEARLRALEGGAVSLRAAR